MFSQHLLTRRSIDVQWQGCPSSVKSELSWDGSRRPSKAWVSHVTRVSEPPGHPDEFNVFGSDKCIWVALACDRNAVSCFQAKPQRQRYCLDYNRAGQTHGAYRCNGGRKMEVWKRRSPFKRRQKTAQHRRYLVMGPDLESLNDEGSKLLPCWGQSHSAFEPINAEQRHVWEKLDLCFYCEGNFEFIRCRCHRMKFFEFKLLQKKW